MTITQKRNEEIRRVYNSIVSRYSINLSHIPIHVVVDLVVNSPASQFYISVEQASRYITAMERGETISARDNRKELMEDLFKVYLKCKERLKGHYKNYIVSYAIHQQAPRFYVSRESIVRIIYQS